MTEADREYYLRRLAEEKARVESGGPTASVHAELAERYAELLAKETGLAVDRFAQAA